MLVRPNTPDNPQHALTVTCLCWNLAFWDRAFKLSECFWMDGKVLELLGILGENKVTPVLSYFFTPSSGWEWLFWIVLTNYPSVYLSKLQSEMYVYIYGSFCISCETWKLFRDLCYELDKHLQLESCTFKFRANTSSVIENVAYFWHATQLVA